MPVGSHEAIARLHEFFPERANWLTAYLKTENDKIGRIKKWRENQLSCFVKSLTTNTFELERAFMEQRIGTLAWVTRNILELSVWIDYCNLSDANAERFRTDAARDFLGLVKAVQSLQVAEYGSEHVGLEQAQRALEAFAISAYGIPTLDDTFEMVSSAAKDLGRGKAFLAMNKLLSKFAHPTAWAVNATDSIEADADFREMFLLDGIEIATESLTKLRAFILLHFPINQEHLN